MRRSDTTYAKLHNKIKMLASTIQFSHNTTPTPDKHAIIGSPLDVVNVCFGNKQCHPRHPTACHLFPPRLWGCLPTRIMIHPISVCWWQPHPGSNTNNPTHRHSPWWVKLKLLRKEVIQPHLPVRLPCYDFVPIADPTFDSSPPKGWATGFGCYQLS